jgi:hypothetical protein
MTTTTDTLFAPLTIASAPEASRPTLEKIEKSLGFIPNLTATFANTRQSWKGTSRWTPRMKRAPSPQENGGSSFWPQA